MDCLHPSSRIIKPFPSSDMSLEMVQSESELRMSVLLRPASVKADSRNVVIV